MARRSPAALCAPTAAMCRIVLLLLQSHSTSKSERFITVGQVGRVPPPSPPASGQQYTRQPGIADGSVSIDWHAFIGSKRAESAPA